MRFLRALWCLAFHRKAHATDGMLCWCDRCDREWWDLARGGDVFGAFSPPLAIRCDKYIDAGLAAIAAGGCSGHWLVCQHCRYEWKDLLTPDPHGRPVWHYCPRCGVQELGSRIRTQYVITLADHPPGVGEAVRLREGLHGLYWAIVLAARSDRGELQPPLIGDLTRRRLAAIAEGLLAPGGARA